MAVIADKVRRARMGDNPNVIARMKSGWAVLGDVQFLLGYSLLLPDPVVPRLNDLGPGARLQYLEDMTVLGDALLKATGAARINYEILGNQEPELHAHLFPRFINEDASLRLRPVWFYDWGAGPVFNPELHRPVMDKIRSCLENEV